MIVITSQNGELLGKFPSWIHVFKFIQAVENAKLLEDHPQFAQTAWSFKIYSSQHVQNLYRNNKNGAYHSLFTEAASRNLEVLDICTGDFENPVMIEVTPDVDLQALKQQWCRQYCQAHHYEVFEVVSNTSAHNQPDVSGELSKTAIPSLQFWATCQMSSLVKANEALAKIGRQWAFCQKKGSQS